MVRTKADGGARKAVAAKAPRKALAPASRPSALMSPKAGGKRDKYGGGNAVNPQPTPEWQKSITRFFSNVPGSSSSSSSSSAGKENADPEGPCSSKDVDRTKEEIAEESSSSSTSKPAPEEESEDEMEQEEEEEEDEDEEEEEEKPAASSKSRKNTNFKRNKCVSDSDDDDDD